MEAAKTNNAAAEIHQPPAEIIENNKRERRSRVPVTKLGMFSDSRPNTALRLAATAGDGFGISAFDIAGCWRPVRTEPLYGVG